MRDESHDDEVIDALRFPRVEVQNGYLTPISVKLLLVELDRRGFNIVKREGQ